MKGVGGVKGPRGVKLAISERRFSIDLDLHHHDLLDPFFSMIQIFLIKRSPVKVTYTYGSALSSSSQIITKLISYAEHAEDFINEINKYLYFLRKTL